MTDFLGNNAVISWVYSGGTIALNSDYRQANDQPSVDLVEVSAGADASKTYLTSLKDGQFNLTMLAQTGGTVLLAALAEGVSGTLIVGEEGTASGKPKTTIPAISMGAQRNIQYNNAVEISVTFQQNGERIYATY